MLGVTFFGVFLTPVFYFVITWFTGRKKPVACAGREPAACELTNEFAACGVAILTRRRKRQTSFLNFQFFPDACVGTRTATVPGFEQFSECERTRLGTIIVDAALGVGRRARQRLLTVVVDAALGVGRGPRQRLRAIIVRTPPMAKLHSPVNLGQCQCEPSNRVCGSSARVVKANKARRTSDRTNFMNEGLLERVKGDFLTLLARSQSRNSNQQSEFEFDENAKA